MTDQKPTPSREFTDDAIQVLNWYRHQGGSQPMTKHNELAVPEAEWKAMSADDKEALWAKYPIKQRP